jgi:hypothetical protein
MVDNNVENQQAVQKMANQIRVAFFLSLLTNLYDIYHFINTSGELRQGISIMFGVLGTALIWQLSKELRAGKNWLCITGLQRCSLVSRAGSLWMLHLN